MPKATNRQTPRELGPQETVAPGNSRAHWVRYVAVSVMVDTDQRYHTHLTVKVAGEDHVRTVWLDAGPAVGWGDTELVQELQSAVRTLVLDYLKDRHLPS